MPITDTDEYIDYSSFNDAGGVTTSDTFNTWRKKTNGIINAIDGISVDNVGPDQLSAGAPTWTTAGALSTYELGSFTAGTINGTIINGSISLNGGSITGTNLKIGSGGSAATAGACHATSLAIGSTNTQFTVSASGGVTGTSLKVGGSSAAVTGGVNALSLAVGTSNTQFTVSNAGDIVGSSLNVGIGGITAGSITGTSLNVGSGSITTTGSISATTFTGSLNGNASSATTAASATTVVDRSVTALKLNGGQTGTAPIYGARAYVVFDGTKNDLGVASTANTARLIKSSGGNVSSVIRNGVGNYTINFEIPMPNANYAAVGSCSNLNTNPNYAYTVVPFAFLTTSVQIGTNNGLTTIGRGDASSVCVSIFG